MTTLTERLPVDEITAQARDVHFGRLILTAIAAVFYAVGWLIARAFFCVAWCGTAVRLGWQAGRKAGQASGGPR